MNEYKKIIENKLDEYFNETLKQTDAKYFKNVLDSMKYTTCLGGKRLRGILCLEACNTVSGNFETAVPTACAIEMLHAQSLIHDDLPCMDNDDLRRGKPSNHKVFGEAIAVLSGDALISFGIQTIIDKTNIEPDIILNVISEYVKAAGAFGIVGGQTADIEAENRKVDEKHLNMIHKYKTGALFKFAIVSGALLAKADEKQLETLREFADKFGSAFQIMDDILDATSNTADLGKTAGKDAEAHKSTYVTLLGLDASCEKLKSIIKDCYDILEKGKINSIIFKQVIETLEKKL